MGRVESLITHTAGWSEEGQMPYVPRYGCDLLGRPAWQWTCRIRLQVQAWPRPLPSSPAHATHSVNLSILHNLSEGHSDRIYHNEQHPGGSGPTTPRGVHANVALQPFSIGDVETTKCPSPGDWLKMIDLPHPELYDASVLSVQWWRMG